MPGLCLLWKLCALLIIHSEVVAKCLQIKQHDASVSAESHQGKAFYALRSCHQILHGDTGEFFSPDYLCSNPGLWCNWTIQVQPGKRVRVHLEDLTPKHMCHLKTDQIHLEESPVSPGERRILERCWRSSMYTSVSNTVHVVQLIRPNPNLPHRGFYGVYQAFGLPKNPDLNEDTPEKEKVRMEEMKAKDAVTKISRPKSFSNELLEVNPQLNEVLTVTKGSFRESRKIRGGAKIPDPSPHDDVDELVSVLTGMPDGTTVNTTMLFSDESRGPYTLIPAYTTLAASTSTGTTRTQSTKKRAPKRKQVLAQLSTTPATLNKSEVTHVSQVTTRTPDVLAEANVAEPLTGLDKDVGAVSMEMLKTDSAVAVVGASEEQVGGPGDDRPSPKKMKQFHEINEKSLPVQTFRLTNEPPPFPGDCSRTSVPTLLYATCFLLCILIMLLMVVLGAMYRHYHRGTFLPHCQRSCSYTNEDINNNPISASGGDGDASRFPPPPPPVHLSDATHDLPLLRFTPLTPPGGFESKQ